jgi:hypothetical protein
VIQAPFCQSEHGSPRTDWSKLFRVKILACGLFEHARKDRPTRRSFAVKAAARSIKLIPQIQATSCPARNMFRSLTNGLGSESISHFSLFKHSVGPGIL